MSRAFTSPEKTIIHRLPVADPSLSLIERASARDKRALRELISALTPVIQARAGRILARRGKARDVRQEILDMVQQVFVALFRDDAKLLKAWDPARGLSLSNFVGLIAEQQVMAILRSKRNNPWIDEPTAPEDLDGSAESDRGPERVTASREALGAILTRMQSHLSDQGLAMFHALYVEGLSVEEVCEKTAMNAAAVYAWRSRLGKLAQKIAREVLSDPALA